MSWDSIEYVERVILDGADIDAEDAEGTTPLVYLAFRGNVVCMTALLYAKADVNKISDTSFTAIHSASSCGQAECLKLLIQHKANLNVLNIFGRSPLSYASQNGQLTSVKLLVAAGAHLDLPDKIGKTPLCHAICNAHPEVAQLLLYSGAKMSNVNPNTRFPDWMKQIVTKRKRVIRSTLILKGVLKKRFKVNGAGSAFLGGRIPKDMVNLIGYHVWSTCLDSEWE